MVEEPRSEPDNKSVTIPPFHQRFNIQVDREEVEKRYISRLLNKIEEDLESLLRFHTVGYNEKTIYNIASRLDWEYNASRVFHDYVRDNFYNCLPSLEALYEIFIKEKEYEAK